MNIVINVTISHEIGERSRGYPITGIQLERFVIGYQYHSHVNHAHSSGFLVHVFALF